MFNGINATNNTLLSLNQNGKSLQESIDIMFDQLNPVKLKKDSDIKDPLKELSESGAYIRDKYAKGIKSKLSDEDCKDKEYFKNDIVILINLIDSICGYKRLTLTESYKEQSFNAIKDYLPWLSDSDFLITDEISVDRESVNFSRMLPMIGFASQSYGYLGRKIIFEGVKEILEESKKDERCRKFETVIFDKDPSNEAVSTQMSDYFNNYKEVYDDKLDEPYDKEKLAILN